MADNIDEQLTSELAYLGEAPQGPAPDAPYFDFDSDPALAQAIDEVPHPSEVQLAQPEEIEIDPLPGSTSVSQGVRASGSGFGPDTGQGSMWDKGYEQFGENDARLRSNRDLATAETDAAYGHAGAAVDLEASIKAEAEQSKAELLRDQENFLRESAELDKVMYAEARADSEKYISAYQEQLAAVRQMAVVNPMQTLGGMEAAGVSLAMFAQGFLAAQGIHIDVGGQVDRWIDRSIQEQQRRIGQAQQGAEDQLNLWRISQETSRNDLEARHRYRGMVLEAMTMAVDVNAARFAAPLAQSAAEVAKANIEVQKITTTQKIRSDYEAARLENLKAMRDEVHKRVEERHRAWGLSIQDKLAKAQMVKAGKGDGKAPNQLVDSRNVKRDAQGKIVSGGLVVGELSHDAPSETQKAVIGKKQLNDSVQSGSDELRRLYAELDGEFGPGWLRNRQSEAYTLFNAERNRIIGDIMRNFTGLAATDKEAQRWLDQLKDDALLQVGPDRLPKLIDGMSAWARRSFEQSLDLPGVIKYKPEERSYSEQVNVDPETSALEQARRSESKRLPTTIEQIAGPAATDSDRVVDRKPSKFYAQHLEAPESSSAADPFASQRVGYGVMKRGSGAEAWAGQLDDLARAALDPTEFMKGKSNADTSKQYAENPEEVQLQAKQALADIAYGRPLAEGKPVPPADRQAYARKLVEMMDSNPLQLKKLLSE